MLQEAELSVRRESFVKSNLLASVVEKREKEVFMASQGFSDPAETLISGFWYMNSRNILESGQENAKKVRVPS